ncbi:MAG: transcriptional regulator, partial [Mesorhizobium sp.]
DWIGELARIADAEGLGGAEKRINYSRSALSTILAGKYTGDIARVEGMVRGALMAMTVDCPVLGEIGRDRCLTEQKEPFRATSRHRAQLFHACKTCPQRR